MTTLDLETLLRRGDPEERAWAPPPFEGLRAHAALAADRTGAATSRPAWMRRGSIAAALLVAVAVVAPGLLSLGSAGGAAPATASPSLPPSADASDLAALADVLGVPREQVLLTDDGAVAVIRSSNMLVLELAARDPAAAEGWVAHAIAAQPDLGGPGSAMDIVACGSPGLVRSIFVYGQEASDTTGPLTIDIVPFVPRFGGDVGAGTGSASPTVLTTMLPLPSFGSPTPVDALGGTIVNGLYVFVVKGPIPTGAYLAVSGPDLVRASLPYYGAVTIPAAQSCAG